LAQDPVAQLVAAEGTPAIQSALPAIEAGALPAFAQAGPTLPEQAPVPAGEAPGAFLGDAVLADQRGGETVILTNQTMTAITSGNVLNGDYAAGAVSLSDGALSSFSGIGNLLINTGGQVSLQTGMNLTINMGQ
jgi:hypothetical protein